MTQKNHPRTILDEAADITAATAEHLRRQAELGRRGIPREELLRAKKRLAAQGVRLNPAETLREIRREMGDCRRCKLWKTRTNLVFGDGDPYARLMFVGEGPGEDEDAQGVPFVGRAGQMLNDIIEKGLRLKRSEVYIANIVKSRPPQNREPEPDEIAACFPFLEKQIEAIRPEVIIALGNIAARTLLGTSLGITRIRGTWHDYKGIPVMPTFHPSYLVRDTSQKVLTWEDIKKVMQKLGIPLEVKK